MLATAVISKEYTRLHGKADRFSRSMPDLPVSVLCVHSDSYNGGAESLLRNGLPVINETHGLAVVFHDVYSRPSVTGRFEALGVPVWRTRMTEDSSVLSFSSGFRRKIDVAAAVPRHLLIALRFCRAFSLFDIFYAHGYKSLLLCHAASVIGTQQPPRPVVWHCHGLGDGGPPPLFTILANRCARVLTDSEDIRKHLIDVGVRPSLIRTIYNAVDHRRIEDAAHRSPSQPLPPANSRRIVLVCPAALRANKGVHLVIEALPSLPQDVEVWVTGDQYDPAAADYLDRLIGLAERGGVRHRVHLLGVRTDLPSVMSLANVVCVPSICREGFGLVAAEAMALGIPVIVSARGGLPEVVGESGLIFDPDQPGDLERQLSVLLADEMLSASLAASAKRRSLQRFTYARWAQEVIAELRATLPEGQYLKPSVTTAADTSLTG